MREPPHNLDAEKAVLGAPLISPRCYREQIHGELHPDDFFLPAHREIFEAYHALDANDDPIDVITLADELKTRGSLPRLNGGESYLVELADALPTAENLGHYIGLVREKSSLRRIIDLGATAQQRAYEGHDPAELIEDLSRLISGIITGKTSNLTLIGDHVEAVMSDLEERARRQHDPEAKKIVGVRFGVEALDELIYGLRPGDHCLIAADTGGGKTSLAIQAALTHTLVDKGRAIVFSMEMTKLQLTERAFAHLGRINSYLLRRGELNYEDFKTLTSTALQIKRAPLTLDAESYTFNEIAGSARRWRARNSGPDAFGVIDFLQLAKPSGRSDNRARFIGETAYAIKELAKELDMPIVTVSSLGRADVKKGPDGRQPRPGMHALKESGDIELSADQIILIWNEEGTEDGEVTLIADKFRGGMARTVKAHWYGRWYCFADVEGYQRPKAPSGNWQDGREGLDS